MASFFSAVRNTFLNLAFPQRCNSCSAHVHSDRYGVACAACWNRTTLLVGSEDLCAKCGACNPFSETAFACRNCVDHHYDTARSIGIYEHAMSTTILNLKRFPAIPPVLLDRIPEILQSEEFVDCDMIVPVPLSRKRRAERGFNQAEYIAERVAKFVDRPVDDRSLSRRIHSPMHRASMDKKARELSVKNAFDVNRPKLIEGRSILLVDDIFPYRAITIVMAATTLRYGDRPPVPGGSREVPTFPIPPSGSV